jgi:asparagine synthase (glutamine-hydrolysing)
MCGIAGIMLCNGTAPKADLLECFRTKLRHRGPDGDGTHSADSLAMVQTRLAIIDLETGDQPIFEPGGAALVANGEIYNYIELRQEMPEVNFATNSDCEPALHLYRRAGLRFTEMLRGMYAIAIHDPADEALVLCRDPFGIKPLYYIETPQCFAFASEPSALIDSGLIEAAIVPQRRDELLQLQFTCGRETIFHGISRVLPGETILVRKGRVVERRCLPALPERGAEPIDIGDAIGRLDEILEDSVNLHQRSDVPYGMFLSGGIDSTSILALMARLNTRPVRTFTVGFGGTGVKDERDHARAVAAAVNAEHVAIEFSEEDFWTLLPRVASSMDDPTADYAILPSWKLAKTAAKDLKVVLTGEGGDELFGGYGRYRSVLRPWWLGGRSIRARGIFGRLGVLRDDTTAWRDGIAAAESTIAHDEWTRLQIAQATDCADWLPNDLLIKVDRCLMAHGVEGRTPFLDRRVAELAFTLPDDLKVRQGLGKWLLRKWLDRTMPEAKAFEKKRGFSVPVGEWIQRQGARIGPLVAANPAVAEVARPNAVRGLFTSSNKKAGTAAWILLFYALWHRRHIEGLPADGNVFDVLAEH